MPSQALALALALSAAALAAAAPHGRAARCDPHSIAVATCRRRGNLFAFYRPLAKCMPLLDDVSPCAAPGALLVLNATSLEARCMVLPCPRGQALLPDGHCHAQAEVCGGRDGMELVLRETGYGACDCRDGYVYWRPTDRCYEAFTRGPCARGEYVVYREGGGVRCESAPCPAHQVPWQGQCVTREGHGCLDSVHGHLRLNPASLRYQCTLHCPDGQAEVGLDCYPLYSRGPCPFGQFVEPVEGTRYGRCVENPCEKDGLLPWAGRCWRAGEHCTADDGDDEESEAATSPPTAAATRRLQLVSDAAVEPTAASAPAEKRRDKPPTSAAKPPPATDERDPSICPPETATARPAPSAATETTTAAASTPPADPSSSTEAPPTPSAASADSSLPLHLQYLLGNAPRLHELPFLRDQTPPRLYGAPPPPPPTGGLPVATSEALIARRSLLPPPPPANTAGLLDILGLPAFRGQASEPAVSSIPAPMRRRMQYTYDGKMIPNPLYRERRRRAARRRPAGAARIVVHPVSRRVECSHASVPTAAANFAHFKCRPGSRRDLLGECRREAAAWTDLHPGRCPFGMRRNPLTGRCKSAA